MPRSSYIREVRPSIKPSKMSSKMPTSTSERYIEPMPGEPTKRRVHWANGYDDEANYNPAPGPAPVPVVRSSSRAHKTTPSYAPVEGTAAYRDYGSTSYAASYPPGAFRSGSSFNQVSPSLLDDDDYFSLSSPSYRLHPRRRRSIRLTDLPSSSSPASPYSQQPRSTFMSTPRSSTLPLSDADLLAAADDNNKQPRRRDSRRSREFEDAITDLYRQLDAKELEIDRTKMESREQKRRIMELERAQRELKIKLKEADDSAERYLDRYRELLAKSSS